VALLARLGAPSRTAALRRRASSHRPGWRGRARHGDQRRRNLQPTRAAAAERCISLATVSCRAPVGRPSPSGGHTPITTAFGARLFRSWRSRSPVEPPRQRSAVRVRPARARRGEVGPWRAEARRAGCTPRKPGRRARRGLPRARRAAALAMAAATEPSPPSPATEPPPPTTGRRCTPRPELQWKAPSRRSRTGRSRRTPLSPRAPATRADSACWGRVRGRRMAASGGAEPDPDAAVVRERGGGGSEAPPPLRAGDRAREGGGVCRGGEGARRAGPVRRGGGVRASRSPAVGRRGRAGLAGGVAEGARRARVWPMGEGAW